MKKYRFAASLLAIVSVIYIICNDVLNEAAHAISIYGINAMSGISMPVYGYVRDLEKNQDSAAVKVIEGIYPVNEYAKDRYFPDGALCEDATESLQDLDDAAGRPGASEDESNANESNAADKASDGGTEGGQSVNSGNSQSSGSEANTNEKVTQSELPSGGDIGQGELSAVVSNNVITGTLYQKAKLEDYNFVLNNFYTVTSITELGSDKLKPSEFLNKDMTITHDASTPQILIFHTHSQEAFADSAEGDASATIVGVGDYLAQILREKYGYNVIHDTGVYDLVDGKLDRSKAYTYAENAVAGILEANPSIEVVIDLHRDGVSDSTRLVTEINGKKTARIMFFNGLSYSRVNGDISYLANPYRDDNLALSLQMQLLGNAYYPGYLRRIYVNAYRYCLHMRAKSMLIEAGAQTNTVEEVMNAMEPLADLLDKTLRGEKCW